MTRLTRRLPRLSALWQNPVTIKELRSRMRGRRAFVVLTVYLLLMSLFISLVYVAYAAASARTFGPDARQAGKTIFAVVVAIQGLVVVFLGPSFTAGAIVGEKERQTYNLLRTTLLPARALVTGKLVSALGYVLLLIVAAVPVQSIALLLGGVSASELLLSGAVLVVSAVAYALLGLFLSSVMRSTLSANVSTFVTAIVLTVGVPALALIAIPLLQSFVLLPGANPLLEVGLLYVGLLLAATNLPATIVISELLLLQENALFYYSETVRGYTVYIFSPWILYLLFYAFLSLLLYLGTVRRVRRIPEK